METTDTAITNVNICRRAVDEICDVRTLQEESSALVVNRSKKFLDRRDPRKRRRLPHALPKHQDTSTGKALRRRRQRGKPAATTTGTFPLFVSVRARTNPNVDPDHDLYEGADILREHAEFLNAQHAEDVSAMRADLLNLTKTMQMLTSQVARLQTGEQTHTRAHKTHLPEAHNRYTAKNSEDDGSASSSPSETSSEEDQPLRPQSNETTR
ncbi:MAG: hypothetical protein BJ554DRAFT_8237, partial [Olpidium bornovanus]